MTKAYGYVRASTARQVLSPEVQRDQITRYYGYKLKPLGYEWGGFYEDPDTSGKTNLRQRAAGSRLDLALRAGDCVVFAALDRGFRNTRDALGVKEAWDARKVGMHLINFQIDTSTSTGTLFFTQMAAFGEFERARISERTREALAARRAAGRPYNNKAPWGWKKHGPHGDRRLVVDKWVRKCGAKFAELYQQGYSLQQIADWCRQNNVKQGDGQPWIKTGVRSCIICWQQLQEAEAKARAEGRELKPYEFRPVTDNYKARVRGAYGERTGRCGNRD
jgi:DNA invertase Pin-like site-specific DNA recombinase